MDALGLFPELRTRQLLATHVRAGTGLEILTGSYVSGIKPDLQSTYSLTSCDLVSHLISADPDVGAARFDYQRATGH
jgi:hypothetical protein